MMFSYFPYAAAFARPEGEPARIDVGLMGIGIVMAPFVFVTVAFVSRNARAPRRVLQSMLLLLPLALAVGLLSPVLGATAAFGVGGSLCLNPPDLADVLRWRLWATSFTVLYVFFLLAVITPAGVFAGGLLPLLMIGFSDEYMAWREGRKSVG
jgi:Na+/melibiose symporter-like transporter